MAYTLREGLGRPLTHAEMDDNFSAIDKAAVARSLNVADSDVGYGVVGETVKSYLYVANQQVAYSVPAAAIGKSIVNVVGSSLNTTEPASYEMSAVTASVFDSIAEIKQNSASVNYGQKVSTPITKWVVTSAATYTLPYADRARIFNSLSIGNGRYLSPTGSSIYAPDFLDESVTASNDLAVGEIASIMRDGLKLDFGGKMFRVYANTTGIPSSGATPATDRAQLLTEMLFLDDLQDITFGAGGLYSADQGSTGTKSYFPSTLYLKGCKNINYDTGSLFEAKGESWGDADDSVTLSFDERQDFMGQNGGHAILHARCERVTGSPSTRFAGSTAACYFASCAGVSLSSPFSNAASLGYNSWAFDGWCGNIADTGFVSFGGSLTYPVSHAETNLRREDGIQAGSSIYAGKGGIGVEDRNMIVNVHGPVISDMYGNGSAKQLGYAFGAGSGSIVNIYNPVVRNCQEVGLLNWSVDEYSELNIYNADAVVGLTAVYIDSQSFGDARLNLKGGTYKINDSRVWVGEIPALSKTSFIANTKPVSTVLVTLDCSAIPDDNPPVGAAGIVQTLITNEEEASYGGIIIDGGYYETSGNLIKSVGWGSSQQGSALGLVVSGGAVFRDTSAIDVSNYIDYTNYSGVVYTYIYHDLRDARFQFPVTNFRRVDGYTVAGGALDDLIRLPSDVISGYVSAPFYRKHKLTTLEFINSSGLSGANSLMNFIIHDNTAVRSQSLILNNGDAFIKCLAVANSVVGSEQRVQMTLTGDVRTQFTAGVDYSYLAG